MGVVSVLQLIDYFTTEGRQPKHGIVCLLNNGEEDYLWGSRAFAYSPMMPFTHTFLNLEGAGAFEVEECMSEGHHWAVGKCSGSPKIVLLSVVEQAHYAMFRLPPLGREVVNQLKNRHDTHAIVGRAVASGDTVTWLGLAKHAVAGASL